MLGLRPVFIGFRVLYDLLDEQRIPRYALHCGAVDVGGGGGERVSRRTGHEQVAGKVEIANGGVLPQSLRIPLAPPRLASARADSFVTRTCKWAARSAFLSRSDCNVRIAFA